jgi:type IV pilus assembly protein PilB
MDKQEEILKLLEEDGLISIDQLEKSRREALVAKKTVEKILIEKKIIDEETLTKVKAKAYNLIYEDLIDKKLDNDVLGVIPIGVAENYRIICFDKKGNIIKVGITDPKNLKAIEAVSFLAKKENYLVEYYLISELSLETAFKQYKSLKQEITSALKTRAAEDANDLAKIKKTNTKEDLKEIVKTAPVAKIVSVIIRHAVDGLASDIHIEPTEDETRVRYRIDGILGTSLILPKNVHSAIVGRIKVMADLKLDETRIPQDGRIRMIINEKPVDLRVSILPLLGDEKVVMRILDMTKKAPTLVELGFTGFGLKVIENSIKKSDGMILVTGPTGSGKSTTLFSLINIINEEGINISTLEDPIEYHIKGVNQSQVKPEIGFSFASGLRSLLRQDPDVIMVGEIRDNETAELAVHAGLTGHLVLSTLHTNDAIGSIPRLADMKVEPFLLGSTLNTVIAQRLVRRICTYCKQKDSLPEDVTNKIKEEIKKIPEETIKEMLPGVDIGNLVFYKGAGCPKCGNSGYSGRVVISEVIDINEKIKNMIMDAKRILKIEDVLASQKFITMTQDGIIKILKGDTTTEEVLRVLHD